VGSRHVSVGEDEHAMGEGCLVRALPTSCCKQLLWHVTETGGGLPADLVSHSTLLLPMNAWLWSVCSKLSMSMNVAPSSQSAVGLKEPIHVRVGCLLQLSRRTDGGKHISGNQECLLICARICWLAGAIRAHTPCFVNDHGTCCYSQPMSSMHSFPTSHAGSSCTGRAIGSQPAAAAVTPAGSGPVTGCPAFQEPYRPSEDGRGGHPCRGLQ
jgi:hypothetical protein